MSYLDEIERAAAPGHFEKVKEVYGDTWPQPYDTLYKEDQRSTQIKGE